LIDIRLRSKVSQEELKQKIGKILTEEDYNLVIHKDTTLRGPNGELIGVFQKGIIPEDIMEQTYPTLHELKALQSNNRGYASGLPRIKRGSSGRTDTAKPISSAVVGSMDKAGPRQYCRLTAFSGKQTKEYEKLFPLFVFIGEQMKKVAPQRWQNQMDMVDKTHKDWVIPNTPFTTITVNNSYPTGVHTDKGDLDEGISTLACIKRGDMQGGYLVLPEYRVAFKMDHGDLLVFDAHQWHGNTVLEANSDDAERISVVCYYRTKMAECGSMVEEYETMISKGESKLAK